MNVRRWLVCVLLSLSALGCSGIGERVIGWYVTRKLDSYLDFEAGQKEAARTRVDALILRIRREELGPWVSFLREVRQGIHDGLSGDDIARLQRRYDARLDAGVLMIAPVFAEILVVLSPAQLDHFVARMREDVDKQYRERDLPREERLSAIDARALELTEDFVGDLDDRQERAFRAIVRGVPDERPAQFRSAQAHLLAFRAFMAEKPDVQRIARELVALWEHRYDALGPGRDKRARRAEQQRALLAVYTLLDAKQKAHAEEQLSDRIRQLKRFAL